MSTLGEFGDPDRSAVSRAITRTAHAMPYLLVLVGSMSVLEWVEVVRYEEWPFIGQYLYALGIAAVIVLSMLHQGLARLCLTCMEEVPADAPVRVQRYRVLLWVSHRAAGLRYFAALLLLLVPLLAAQLVLGLRPGSVTFLRAPLDLFVLAVLVGQWLHHRYRPWCPYCRRWDDGGGMREPSPDPVGDGTKVTS